MVDRKDVSRAEWQLWAVTFAIIGVLVGAIIYLATGAAQADLTGIPSRVLLVVSLGALVLGFVTYAIDRERGLKRLHDDLVSEQLSHERLAARLASLAELTRERDTNAALLDASADGFAVVDASSTIVRFNPAMAALAGLSVSDAIGSPALDVLRVSDATGTPLEGKAHPLAAMFADGVARTRAELQLQRADGSTHWVSATFSPILDAGAPVLALVVFRDIGAQKESETMQRDFVSMAAHELRSPLTAIKGFTRTLMTKFSQLDDERRAHYLGVVNEQSNRLARLIDDLMQVSRIDSQRVRLEPEPLDVPEMVGALREQFRSKWVDRAIEVQAEPNVPSVLADTHKLEEILINLIDNAVKYSPSGAPVHVGITTRDGDVEVAIRDNGRGISPDDIGKLFGKFQRLPSTASEVPGTGLGLYIVKGLIEAHGGSVWVHSAIGEGSTFTFTLPSATAAVRAEAQPAATG